MAAHGATLRPYCLLIFWSCILNSSASIEFYCLLLALMFAPLPWQAFGLAWGICVALGPTSGPAGRRGISDAESISFISIFYKLWSNIKRTLWRRPMKELEIFSSWDQWSLVHFCLEIQLIGFFSVCWGYQKCWHPYLSEWLLGSSCFLRSRVRFYWTSPVLLLGLSLITACFAGQDTAQFVMLDSRWRLFVWDRLHRMKAQNLWLKDVLEALALFEAKHMHDFLNKSETTTITQIKRCNLQGWLYNVDDKDCGSLTKDSATLERHWDSSHSSNVLDKFASKSLNTFQISFEGFFEFKDVWKVLLARLACFKIWSSLSVHSDFLIVQRDFLLPFVALTTLIFVRSLAEYSYGVHVGSPTNRALTLRYATKALWREDIFVFSFCFYLFFPAFVFSHFSDASGSWRTCAKLRLSRIFDWWSESSEADEPWLWHFSFKSYLLFACNLWK